MNHESRGLVRHSMNFLVDFKHTWLLWKLSMLESSLYARGYKKMIGRVMPDENHWDTRGRPSELLKLVDVKETVRTPYRNHFGMLN